MVISKADVVPLKSDTRINANSGEKIDDAIIASAETIHGSPDSELVLEGAAEIRRTGSVFKADKIVYTQFDDIAWGEGNAEVSRSGLTFRGPRFSYRLDAKSGEAKDVEFNYAPNRLRGEAKCVRFQSGDTTEMEDSFITTCRKGDNSWWIEMNKLTLDEYDQTASGTGAVLKFAGVPVLGTPWFTFPASGKRRSGLLAPSLSVGKRRGLDITVPYYFNIAPNYDYTLTPRFMTKAGIILGNELRLMTKDFKAEIYGDYMHKDKADDAPDGHRWGLSAKLSGSTAGLGYGIDYNKVSDDNFTSDYGESLKDSSDSVLPQDFWVNYTQTYWNVQASVRKNQTLNINGVTYEKPYEKVPQVLLNGYVADLAGFELTTVLDATRFELPFYARSASRPNADRFVIDQTVAYPLMGAGWFLTPKAKLVGSWYNVDREESSTQTKHPSRVLPIFSVDSGLTFERTTSVNARSTTQTIEPRVFYTYIPKENQDDIPILDSSLSEMNFAQLFTENAWTGYDRVEAANHVTAALTTRMIDDENGAEWLRAAIGQRYYFDYYKLRKDGDKEYKSDLLVSLGAKLYQSLTLSGFGQYNYERKDFNRASVGLRWQPHPMSVVGLYYRYNHVDDPNSDLNFKQIDFSAQWPIMDHWYLLARLNYSPLKHRWVEAIAGLEYAADCWTLRLVAQRYITSKVNKENETVYGNEMKFFVQLELTGLGGIGTNPREMLEEGIPGYQAKRSTVVPGRIGAFDYYH